MGIFSFSFILLKKKTKYLQKNVIKKNSWYVYCLYSLLYVKIHTEDTHTVDKVTCVNKNIELLFFSNKKIKTFIYREFFENDTLNYLKFCLLSSISLIIIKRI